MAEYAVSGQYYDPMQDCLAVRVSMCDRRGGEFWRIVAVEPTRDYRARRDAALDAIEEAVVGGAEPGEVK